MSFPPDVVENLLVACHRRCCICHKFAGNKMEIHHITPKSIGGKDTEDNGIPLCLDCHAEVGSYNDQHPKGRKFTSSELSKHKEQWFAICKNPPWQVTRNLSESETADIKAIDDTLFSDLRLDDRRPAQKLVNTIMQQDRSIRENFVKRVFIGLQSKDEETRWKFANLVEELILWEPKLIPPEVLVGMSRDISFSVRSSAAVCYYYLAKLEPSAIPLDTLIKLASYNEDWYVQTPATNAMLRLARARPVIVDVISKGLDDADHWAREYAAASIRRMVKVDWDLISDELLTHMLRSSDKLVRNFGKECSEVKREAKKETDKDYPMF